MDPEDVKELIRAVIREELAALAPADIPAYRIMARRREDLGLTQEQVGKDLGYSTSTVGAWDTGRLPMKSADTYAAYLGLKLVVVEAEPGNGPPLVTDALRELNPARARSRSRVRERLP